MKQLATVKRVEDWFDPHALYAAKNLLPKNERLYYISPDNFLALALKTNNPQGSKKKRGRLDELIENEIKFSQIPYLRLKYRMEADDDLKLNTNENLAEVWGHEGRHRSLTLKELGFKKMPVIVKFQEMKTIPEYVLNENVNKKYKFNDMFKPYK